MICVLKIPTIMWATILINDCIKIGHFFHEVNLTFHRIIVDALNIFQ